MSTFDKAPMPRKPSAVIEELHQKLLVAYSRSVEPGPDGRVDIPLHVVIAARLEAHEQFLDSISQPRQMVELS
jgi:hypothetical protein